MIDIDNIIITSENCREVSMAFSAMDDHGDTTGKAGAWQTVFNWARQHGMKSTHKSGIESVIDFLELLVLIKRQGVEVSDTTEAQ